MNTVQLILLLLFTGSCFVIGVACYLYLRVNRSPVANRSIYLGETLLLGSTVLYGVFMVLGMFHLYMKEFLFVAVALGYLLLLRKDIREEIGRFFKKPLPKSISFYVLICFLCFFIFRNYFFNVDVDSHSSYLHAQKLWLTYKTSIFGNAGHDIRIFAPHFEHVLSSLGMAFFPRELLYPELINIFFRVIVVFLVYGYTTYRFHSLYGLAASFFVMFNLHFYVSGANKWVLMNGALIAFSFGVAFNFYESSLKSDQNRFLLALIYIMQMPSNKYQSLYNIIIFIILGFYICPSLMQIIKKIIFDKRMLIAFFIFFMIASLHYIKNWIATGLPFFPVFAGHFNTFNWEMEKQLVFNEFTRGATWKQIFKYNGFLFLWHNMRPAFWVFIAFFFLPIIQLWLLVHLAYYA